MNVIFGPAGEGSTDGFGAGRSEGAACARAGKEAAHQGAVARTAQAQGGHAGHSSAAGGPAPDGAPTPDGARAAAAVNGAS